MFSGFSSIFWWLFSTLTVFFQYRVFCTSEAFFRSYWFFFTFETFFEVWAIFHFSTIYPIFWLFFSNFFCFSIFRRISQFCGSVLHLESFFRKFDDTSTSSDFFFKIVIFNVYRFFQQCIINRIPEWSSIFWRLFSTSKSIIRIRFRFFFSTIVSFFSQILFHFSTLFPRFFCISQLLKVFELMNFSTLKTCL